MHLYIKHFSTAAENKSYLLFFLCKTNDNLIHLIDFSLKKKKIKPRDCQVQHKTTADVKHIIKNWFKCSTGQNQTTQIHSKYSSVLCSENHFFLHP